ncbi:MAG TPA: hypothetical protein VF176_04970 [Solirubrobacterales bacterium]
MNSNAGRALIGAAVVVVAVVLLIVLKDSGNGGSTKTSTTKSPTIPTIVIRNGKPVGGVRELSYTRGDRIRFRIDSDVGDEIHVHGYDLMKDVKAGGSVSFDFTADIEGIFEAELEDRGEQIAELRVNP